MTAPDTATATPARPVSRGPGSGEVGRGTLLGIAAYGIWGFFPLYFDALKPAGAWEILAHRILWTLVVCVLVLAATRDVRWVAPLVRRPRTMLAIAVAAGLIAVNWVVYVGAVTAGHVSDAALGYFLNPLVTVALGVVVLKERLRPLQWVAVAIGVVAGLFLAVAGGRVPWVALVLAMSFALYGLTKNRLGATLPALHGLTVETVVLAPVAAVILAVVGAHGGLELGRHGGVHTALLVGSGVATSLPLLAFAAAARRIPLVTVGLIQFLTPVLQLLCGVLLLGEVVPPARWVGFGIVWVALVVLTVDSLLALRRATAARPAA
ncbi:MAG TPA: EamA family transporter RarD [Intrasporangium sp.]|uniref:EamA family transporter RarD n=1 Tax=Intrasporangium sp. TaxID=1925024 RepID=UPI002D766362|nr:EamA family transporter RarD [Intrasporangium sp.]HET7398810.1 EamA family transporter RarD [Intrasporangium sp.]